MFSSPTPPHPPVLNRKKKKDATFLGLDLIRSLGTRVGRHVVDEQIRLQTQCWFFECELDEIRNVFLSVMCRSGLSFEAQVMDKFRGNVWLDLDSDRFTFFFFTYKYGTEFLLTYTPCF